MRQDVSSHIKMVKLQSDKQNTNSHPMGVFRTMFAGVLDWPMVAFVGSSPE